MLNRLMFLVSAVLFSVCVCSQAFDVSKVIDLDINNLRQTGAMTFAGGQPDQQQLAQLQQVGIKQIVSLRPNSELNWDERRQVESLGMSFHQIPVAGLDDINLENATALQKILSSSEGPVYLHCASGNRVGALIAVIENQINQQSVEGAIEEGGRWGLTRLAPAVKNKLSQQ